jgi:hypothetical protein
MARVTCRTCGHTQDVSHFGMYSPIHLFPGVIFIYCPKCKRFRLHRKFEAAEVSPADQKPSSTPTVRT